VSALWLALTVVGIIVVSMAVRRFGRAWQRRTLGIDASHPPSAQYYLLVAAAIAVFAVIFLMLALLAGRFSPFLPLTWVTVIFLLYKAWRSAGTPAP